MFVKCLSQYQGFATKERLCRRGETYRVSEDVGQYLLTTGCFEIVEGAVDRAIHIDARLPAPEFPSEVEASLRDSPEMALVILLKSQLSAAAAEGERIDVELGTCVAHLELLRSGIAIGTATDEEVAEADTTADKVSQLEAQKAKNETVQRGLRKRLHGAEEARDLLKLKKLCERFHILVIENQRHYTAYRETAQTMVEVAGLLWGDNTAAKKLASAVQALQGKLGVPVERRFLEGTGMRIPDLNDRISRGLNDRSGRGPEKFQRGQ